MKTNYDFLDWFNEIEAYGLRSERYYEETTGNPARGYEWLKAAFEAGANTALGRTTTRSPRVAALLKGDSAT
jgi:hypothetical protein